MLSHQFIQSSDPKSNQKYANLLVLYVKATFHVDDLLKSDSFFYCFLLMHSWFLAPIETPQVITNHNDVLDLRVKVRSRFWWTYDCFVTFVRFLRFCKTHVIFAWFLLDICGLQAFSLGTVVKNKKTIPDKNRSTLFGWIFFSRIKKSLEVSSKPGFAVNNMRSRQ